MTKNLTLEQVKDLKVGEWIWVADNEVPINTGYYKVESKINAHINLKQGARALLPYSLYDKEYIIYKDKEESGVNEITRLINSVDVPYVVVRHDDGSFELREVELYESENGKNYYRTKVIERSLLETDSKK